MNIAVARIITAIFVVATILALWFAQFFKIDASADTLLTKSNTLYLLTQQASQRYNPEEFILIAYKPKESGIFSEDVLTLVDTVAKEINALERVESVRSLVNVPIFAGLKSIDADIDPDALSWKHKRYSEERMRYALTHHPLYEDLLYNKAQTALSMQVVFKDHKELSRISEQIVDIESHRLERELTDEEKSKVESLRERKSKIDKELNKQREKEIDTIRDIVRAHSNHGEYFMGGNNLLAYQMINIIKSDLVVFGSAILVIVSLLLLFLFRRIQWLVLPLVCCFVSVLFTLGLLGGLGIKVTVISANVVALQIILTLAVVIHIMVQYQEEAEKLAGNGADVGGDKKQTQLVITTVKAKIKPCFYAGVTTAIGFGALIFSGIQPVISFGWMMVLALAVTLLVSLVLFPCLLIGFCSPIEDKPGLPIIGTLMSGMAKVVQSNGKMIVGLSGALCVAGLVGCVFLTAENSFLNYFKKSTDVSRELTFIDKEFGGSTPFDVLITLPEEQRNPKLVLTADAIQTIERVQNTLAEKEAIGSITSVADFTRMAAVASGKPLVEYELSALYLALDKQLKEDLFGAYFAQARDEVRISMRVVDSTPDLNREALVASVHKAIQEAGITPDNYQLSGLFILYQDIIARLMESQLTTLLIVYAAMAAVLLVIFKSLKIALISLVPNVITTAAIMGFLGYAGIPLDLMTMTIAAVAMGISVDDTIHYVHRFLEEADQNDPVARTNLSVGYALLYTTTIICIGFLSLVFSEFVPSIVFGLLTGLAMLLALVTDITILPVLLKRFCCTGNAASLR